ncbi:caspase family protein [[Phormidium] sp. ETS-05]|uniref:caspase family protein n=1 Tax=[Phormidium] sp. ETS-05 TaxID=222819 RepID=UPI0018EEF028|nr:caspase family protein [[Phormidium] sp. ETS-05]
MGLNRREFLQRASGVLATMGISETLLWQMGDRYYQALAQPASSGASRKLALLVGINQYPAGVPLTGCLTDVELQRELLTNRLGFHPRDILTLTDAQATRQNIEEAFLNHLTAQAGAGDVVLFHFSGYGRSLYSPGADVAESDPESSKPHQSLVPVDGGSSNGEDSSVNDLLLETLWLLLGTLNTNRALAVLDTSYAYPGSNLQGNLRIRSRPSPARAILNPQERAKSVTLQAILREKNSKLNQKAPAQGTVLAATGPDLIAAEARWEGFSSGVFTYALTQQLWLATSAQSLQFTMQGASCVVGQVAGSEQQPQLMEFNPAKNLDKLIQPIETTLIQDAPAADGAVIAYDEGSKTGSIWLGGLPPLVLQSYEENSLLEVVPPVGADSGPAKLQVRSRDGLTAKVQILTPEATIQPGQLVREYLRVLPRNVKLSIALDPSLQRIERVDATSALAAIANVSPVVADSGSADCLFGRVRKSPSPKYREPACLLYPKVATAYFLSVVPSCPTV